MSVDLRRQPGLAVVAFGLFLGALADGLLRAVPWGLNATVLSLGLLAVLLLLDRALGVRRGWCGGLAAVAVAGFAGGFVWRDAVVLRVMDVLALIVAFGFLASTREGSNPVRSFLVDAVRVLGSLIHMLLGPPLLLAQDVHWTRFRVAPIVRGLVVLTRALLLALPILVVFTLLLASADAVFALRARQLFAIDPLLVLSHVFGVSVGSWLAAGLLRAALLREEPAHRLPGRPDWLRLGSTEIAVVLGLVDLLFAAFVWIQLRYLFGGAAFVEGAVGLTYAQYARRGFFELVTVACLVVLLLLVAHWLLDPARGTPAARRFCLLAGAQILLVGVMLVSAFERMRLYRAEFGLTELRFYTTAFMLWVGVLLAGFLVTVLRGQRDAFRHLVLATAVAAMALLHVVDPESRIVEANRATPRGFDLDYAMGLGADAVPALLELAPTLGDAERRELVRGLGCRWASGEAPDWRTWNGSRARARRQVQDAISTPPESAGASIAP